MIIKKIEKVVKNNLDKIAYKVDNQSITYRELWEKGNKNSYLLKREGNSPVIVYGGKEIDTFVSIISCVLANRPYVPIGLCTPINRLKKIVEMTGSSLILTNEKINLCNANVMELDDLKKFEKLDTIEQKNNSVYIIFTSGSTGNPKGVPISKKNLNNFIEWISNLDPLKSYKNSIVLNQASFSFDLSVVDIYYSLCNGHTIIAYDNDNYQEYEKIFDLLEKENIEIAVLTPTFAKLLLLNKDFNYKNYRSLKCIYFCGEILEKKVVNKLFESFPDIKIINAYGPTEATSAVSAILITKEMLESEELLPVGIMNKNATEIEIENGEIILKGKSVFSGYLDNYEGGYYKENNLNCYKTGDKGYIENNKLYCLGRNDSQIKYKGYRIELNDIENNLSKIKGILECAVVDKKDEKNIVKTIKAFVVVSNKKYDIKYIKGELQKNIPKYMMPKIIKILDKLPINQNGKIDRKALKKL